MPRAPKPKTKPGKPRPNEYSVHPGVAMVMKWVAELKQKTGRDFNEWCKLIRKDGPTDLAKRRDWLKTNFKLGTNTVWWLAERADGQPTWDESPEAYLAVAPVHVDEMFSGAKAAMRPISDALMRMAKEVAADIKFCPCKTIIPFYREYVAAQIKPSTKTRIDFGLSLGSDVPFTARLKNTGASKRKIVSRTKSRSPSQRRSTTSCGSG